MNCEHDDKTLCTRPGCEVTRKWSDAAIKAYIKAIDEKEVPQKGRYAMDILTGVIYGPS